MACRPEKPVISKNNTIEITKIKTNRNYIHRVDSETAALLSAGGISSSSSNNNAINCGSDALTAMKNLATVMMIAGLVIFGCFLLYRSVDYDPLYYFSDVTIDEPSPIRNIALYSVLSKAVMADNKTVILTTLNDAWAEPGSIFDLFLESFRIGNGTRDLLNNLVVVAMDDKAYSRCLKVHPHCFDLTTQGTDFSGEADFMSSDYLQMMWRRIEFLRQVLVHGYDFVFTDTDIMWLRNPFPRFLSDADFQIACDHFLGDGSDKHNSPNGGFTYVKSNNRTIQFYGFWHQSRTHYPGKHDQDVFNRIKTHPVLSKIGLRLRFLDTAFFGGFCEVAKDFNKVCTMHANCCVGLDNKIADLAVLLDDWRNFMTGGDVAPAWHVPNNCKGSFTRTHKPHKQHHSGPPIES